MITPKKIFISSSNEDQDALQELGKFLGPLVHKGDTIIWTTQNTLPGKNWKSEIIYQIENADIILLLISANFLSSDFINAEIIPRVFRIKDDTNKHIVPIILNFCLWQNTFLKDLKVLPQDGRPIKDFPNPSQAWSEIANSVLAILNSPNHKQLETKDISLPNIKIIESHNMEKEKVISLININLDEAFEVLDKLFLNKNSTYNDLVKEFIERPDNFSIAVFRSKLIRFVNLNFE